MRYALILATLTFSLSACAAETQVQPSQQATPPPEQLSKKPMSVNKWYTGTLAFYNLEGGFFGFKGENGERFLPLNLPKQYQQNGAKVRIFGRVDNNIMTIQQWGTPFQVEDVELLKAGDKPETDPSRL